MVSLELEQKIEKVIQGFGFELYDISFLKENKNDIFRISIASNTKRVTLDVCQEISEVLSPLLDVYIRDDKPYFMEVSSPGIERILKTPRHFSLSLNQKVLVRLDNKEEFEAILKDLNDSNVTFEIDGVNQQYPFDRLKKVKTILEW